MARSAPEPSRPTTRSMTMQSTRRSTRLSGAMGNVRLPLSLSEMQVRSGSKKRKRAPTPTEQEPLSSKPRKKCAPVEVQAQRKGRTGGDCESLVPEGPSGSGRKILSRDDHSSSREKELEEQLERALQAEQELTVMVKKYKISSAQATLKELEEYFACPLCFEVMACPYSLIPRHCGHTFCATCILKWFFSRLHRGCGGWHESVDCPMCRSTLPYTPDQTPRPDFSFPFIPNRSADMAVQGLIKSMSQDLANVTAATSNLPTDWNEDGHAKQEWSKRESRAGRTEMTALAAQWSNLRPMDFVNIKARLEV
ncbi:hypothetical protein HYDPIDRAFT_130946 [Hydnomerulius pinastri MD-312]|nr:hypothetical protein HYDPIDRAFT_130946 [Hydnomerulius pinastri MD-312]